MAILSTLAFLLGVSVWFNITLVLACRKRDKYIKKLHDQIPPPRRYA